jgi:hypothetical protein
VDRSRGLSWSGEMASGEVSGLVPGIWDELAAGTPEPLLRLGVMAHPDSIHRTAGYVTRMSGGVGGGRPRGPSLSRFLRHEVAMCTAGRRRKRRSSQDVVSSVSALWGRHRQRWGLKHAVAGRAGEPHTGTTAGKDGYGPRQ